MECTLWKMLPLEVMVELLMQERQSPETTQWLIPILKGKNEYFLLDETLTILSSWVRKCRCSHPAMTTYSVVLCRSAVPTCQNAYWDHHRDPTKKARVTAESLCVPF